MNRPIPRHNVNLSSEELKLVVAGAVGRGEHAGGRERFEAAGVPTRVSAWPVNCLVSTERGLVVPVTGVRPGGLRMSK